MVSTMNMNEASQPQDEQFLTLEDSVTEIQEMGFREVRLRQVQRWANERKLPYFRLGKRFYIERMTLRHTFRGMQNKAIAENSIQ